MKNILVIEDDKRTNEIICDYLETDNYNVFMAYDGLEALELFEKEDINLVILDIMMPKIDGFSVCRKIRQKSDVLIIILSARVDEDDKLMGFEFGADEYVTKPFSPKVLVARVNALLKRNIKTVQTHDYIVIGDLCIDKSGYRVTIKEKEIHMTIKEFSLLQKLIDNKGTVLTRDRLIKDIWGYDYFGDGRIVDTNIKTLRKKLGKYAKYIYTVIGVGYKFEVKNEKDTSS